MAQNKLKTQPPTLADGTKNLINQIESKEIRDILLLGLHPAEVVEGWYFALASAILKQQRKKSEIN